MRFMLSFTMDNEFMPLDYHKAFLKFIKTALSQHMDGEFFDDFYSDDIAANVKKDISWSIRLHEPKFHKTHIDVMGKKVDMTFLSPSNTNSFLFHNAFLEQRNMKFPISEKNSIVLENIKPIREKDIVENTIQVKFLSPLLVRDHDRTSNRDNYWTVADDDFIIKLKENLKRQFKGFENEIDELKLDISKLQAKVVLLYGQYIDANMGTMLMVGEPELLDTLVKNSMGSRRPLGFGVMNVLDRWEVKM